MLAHPNLLDGPWRGCWELLNGFLSISTVHLTWTQYREMAWSRHRPHTLHTLRHKHTKGQPCCCNFITKWQPGIFSMFLSFNLSVSSLDISNIWQKTLVLLFNGVINLALQNSSSGTSSENGTLNEFCCSGGEKLGFMSPVGVQFSKAREQQTRPATLGRKLISATSMLFFQLLPKAGDHSWESGCKSTVKLRVSPSDSC